MAAEQDIQDLEWMAREHGPVTIGFDGEAFTLKCANFSTGPPPGSPPSGLPIDSVGLAIMIGAAGLRVYEEMSRG